MEGTTFGGSEKRLLESGLLQAGIHPTKVDYKLIHPLIINELNQGDYNVIVTLGERAMHITTGKRNLEKWQLSPLDSVEGLRCPKVVPTFNFRRLNAQYDHRFYFYRALIRAVKANQPGAWTRKSYNFRIDPTFDKTIEVLRDILENRETVAVDIETSHGIINTMGFAWSSCDAIAVKCRPEDMTVEQFHMFWGLCRDILESPRIKKIYQNNIFETAYFALYGIDVQNTWHDTMHANKVLYPEFKSGLGNVGRLFTMEPYWKDIGKEGDDEKRDWNKIDNWHRHLLYNCYDTTGTFEAATNQRRELIQRNLCDFFDNYIMRLCPVVKEMCLTGLIVDEEKLQLTRLEVLNEIEEVIKDFPEGFNHRSSKQKQKLLKEKGYRLPRQTDKKTGQQKETTDSLALKKLRLKHPEDQDIENLLKVSKLEKFKGSYLDFDYRTNKKVNYTFVNAGTETLRFASKLDPWGYGFNAQTIPKKAKGMFRPPEGHVWLNVDLEKAESFFVAYRSCDETLMHMLKNKEDIHSYVASKIFNCSIEQVLEEKRNGDESKRQLGKKSGHGGNYAMAAKTFQDSCLKEMDLVISLKEAKQVLEGYHAAFPGIRRWHRWVEKQIWDHSRLENPLGYHRYFYGRKDPGTFREAYAWEPQSTIPMIMNYMILAAFDARTEGKLNFNLHIQCHDSALFSVKPEHLEQLVRFCKDYNHWHPEIILPGGKLTIPTSAEYGPYLDKLEEYNL
jgi:DNA polymerase I-like protein with 3'-5' exonuclease and polymerase domains